MKNIIVCLTIATLAILPAVGAEKCEKGKCDKAKSVAKTECHKSGAKTECQGKDKAACCKGKQVASAPGKGAEGLVR